MIAIWDAALMVQEAAWGVYTVRVANKVWRPLPTLTPLPPVMTAEQLKEMLNPVTTAAEQPEKSQN